MKNTPKYNPELNKKYSALILQILKTPKTRPCVIGRHGTCLTHGNAAEDCDVAERE